jgi:hypothetical protein
MPHGSLHGAQAPICAHNKCRTPVLLSRRGLLLGRSSPTQGETNTLPLEVHLQDAFWPGHAKQAKVGLSVSVIVNRKCDNAHITPVAPSGVGLKLQRLLAAPGQAPQQSLDKHEQDQYTPGRKPQPDLKLSTDSCAKAHTHGTSTARMA